MSAERRVRIIPASPAHVGRIANRMRGIDRMEVQAKGRGAKAAVRLSLRSSTWACTAMLDGEPVAMFGVVAASLIEDKGRPWFLGSDDVYRNGRAMLSIGPRVIERMHGDFRRLENVVSSGNVRAIRLLRRWGFTVEGEEIMAGGVPFVAFWREADV